MPPRRGKEQGAAMAKKTRLVRGGATEPASPQQPAPDPKRLRNGRAAFGKHAAQIHKWREQGFSLISIYEVKAEDLNVSLSQFRRLYASYARSLDGQRTNIEPRRAQQAPTGPKLPTAAAPTGPGAGGDRNPSRTPKRGSIGGNVNRDPSEIL